MALLYGNNKEGFGITAFVQGVIMVCFGTLFFTKKHKLELHFYCDLFFLKSHESPSALDVQIYSKNNDCTICCVDLPIGGIAQFVA